MTSFKNLDDMNDGGEKDGARSDIYANMQLKTTEDLQAIWDDNDRQEWSDAAFDVVKELLIERTGQVSPQDDRPLFFNPERFSVSDEKGETSNIDWKAVEWKSIYSTATRLARRPWYTGWPLTFIVIGLIISCFMIAFPEDRTGYFPPLTILGLTICIAIFWSVTRRRVHPVVCAARIGLKQMIGFNHDYFQFVLHVRKGDAFLVTVDEDLRPLIDWEGSRDVRVPQDLYNACEEKDLIRLLCLTTGEVLGDLEQMVELPEIAAPHTSG